MASTIADISVPGETFAIGRILSENRDIYIELERLVPLGDRLLPFFWISDGSLEYIQAALESQDGVDSMKRLTEVDGEHLFQVSWTKQKDGLVNVLIDTEGVILEGKGIDGQWELRIRFPDHEQFRSFNEQCDALGIDVSLKGVYNPHAPALDQHLTSTQWQTLAIAYERGYFNVPRQTSLEELSNHFGVSQQAISQRLRRGTRSLVGWLMFNASLDA